jgi:hypothetical protein
MSVIVGQISLGRTPLSQARCSEPRAQIRTSDFLLPIAPVGISRDDIHSRQAVERHTE